MKRDKKTQRILKIIKKYKVLFGFKGYRLNIKITTASEDRELIKTHALMRMSSIGKTIFIKLSETICKRMKYKELKKLIIHELLHVFFWDISDLYDKIVDKYVEDKKENKRLKQRYEKVEEDNVNHLVEVFTRIEKKSKLEQKEKIGKLFNGVLKKT